MLAAGAAYGEDNPLLSVNFAEAYATEFLALLFEDLVDFLYDLPWRFVSDNAVVHPQSLEIETAFRPAQHAQRKKDKDGGEQGQHVKPPAAGHADRRHHEDGGGRGQPGHPTFVSQNGARANESDP